jgi:predicted short-subunit dehydrogenase-like oxidoreductase (DUF2520 family)
MNMQASDDFLAPDMIRSAVIIGTGNVAWHLGRALKAKNISILQIAGRTGNHAMKLAQNLEAEYTMDITKINVFADLYIIAVSDDAIADIAQRLCLENQLVVHTAGSIPMSVFHGKLKNYGVFYPLQTFTRSREIHFHEVPVCIEANNPDNLEKLFRLAGLISYKVLSLNSDKRATLHLAAVFACNFTNHMYSAAEQILKKNDMDFSMLHPLIIETAMKAASMKPLDAQTGPAVRNNRNLMDKHLKMLEKDPALREIYLLLSENILKYLNDEL